MLTANLKEETKIGTWIDGKPIYRKTPLFSKIEVSINF